MFFKRIAFKSNYTFLLLLVLLILLAFWRLTFIQAIPGEEDNFTFNFPYKAVFADFLKNGSLPFWNPYAAFGFPQYAQAITAAFYLPDLIFFYLLPLIPAFNYTLLFHLIIPAIFTFLFARSIGISEKGSFLTAFTFIFSGWMLGLLGATQNFYPLAWFPVTLWLIELYFQRKKIIYLFLAAFSLALSILAAFPQITIYTIYACSFYFLFRTFKVEKEVKGRVYHLLAWLLILVISAGLSGIWLLPLLEVTLFSPRKGGVGFAYAQQGSLNPLFLLFNFYPNLLLGKNGIIGRYICLYIGILPLFFALYAFSHREKKTVSCFFLFLLLFSFLFSLGKYNPLFPLFLRLPGLSFFRQPWRILFWFEFSLAILAGYGFDNFSARNRSKNLFLVFLFWIFAILPLVVLLVKPFILQTFNQGKIILVLNSLRNEFLILPALTLFFSAVLVFLYQKKFLSLSSFKNLALTLIVLDLVLFGWQGRAFKFFPLSLYNSYYQGSAGANFLKYNPGLYRIYSLPVPHQESSAEELYPSKEEFWKDTMNLLLTSNNMLFAYQSAAQSDFALGLVNAIRVNELIEGKSAEGHQYDPGNLKRLEKLSHLLGFLNVKYVFSKETLNSKRYKMLENGEYKVYQNLDYLPRALVVCPSPGPSQPLIPDLKDCFTELRLSKYVPLNPQNIRKRALILKYQPTEVIVSVNSDKKGYLVLTDAFYPGWRCEVNGKETKIFLTDYVFRAVKIPPGKSLLRFWFEPESYKGGLFITLISFLVWAGLLSASLVKDIYFGSSN